MAHRLTRLIHYSLLLLLLAPTAAAADNQDIYVPELLKPWVRWVTDRDPALNCAIISGERHCIWPSYLQLTLNATGGTFEYRVTLDAEESFFLPGGGAQWPVQTAIVVGGKESQIPVFSDNNRPFATLKAGSHHLRGSFSWEALPERITVPDGVGILDLSIDGKQIQNFQIAPNAELWLRKESAGEQQEADTVDIAVHRKLTDGLPFRIVTRLELRIGGRGRELKLGDVLPAGTIPLVVQSPLSYQLDDQAGLTLQIRSGVFAVTVESVFAAPPAELGAATFSNKVPGWPLEEIWVWESNELLRSVELSGPVRVDAARTTLPAEWRAFPAYAVAADGAKLSIRETRRGQVSIPPNAMNLLRVAKLDLDGSAFTIRDTFTGTLNQSFRLNMKPSGVLGHAAAAGVDQLITKDVSNGLSGIELREQNLNITAVSRTTTPRDTLDAVGWDTDVNSLELQLTLPPGWKLLGVDGADEAERTWISSWSLLDLFVLMLVSITAAKLLGWRIGLVAFLALVISHDVLGSPYYLWFNLLGSLALTRALPDSRMRRWATVYYYLAVALFVLFLIPFSVDQIRSGLYPQVATPQLYGTQPNGTRQAGIAGNSYGNSSFSETSYDDFLVRGAIGSVVLIIEGPVGATFMVAFTVAAVAFLLRRRWGLGSICVAIAIGVFILRSLVGLFFGTNFEAGGDYNRDFSGDRLYGANAPFDYSPQAPSKSTAEGIIGHVVNEIGSAESKNDEALLEYPQRSVLEKHKTLQQQSDPKAVIQTGPAMPSWEWNSWLLRWNGPVTADQELSLYLLSPGLNLLLAVLRVALFTLLALAFLDLKNLRPMLSQILSGITVIILSLCASPTNCFADPFPSDTLLQELSSRINAKVCNENCTASNNLQISVAGEGVRVTASVSSDGIGAWAIPGPIDQLMPQLIEIDGAKVTATRSDTAGLVWVRIPTGFHTVTIQGTLARSDLVTLQFGLNPGHLSVDAKEWEVDGLTADGSISGTLQLVRKGGASASSGGVKLSDTKHSATVTDAEQATLPQWLLVEREALIGLPWTLTTKVTRLGSIDRGHLSRVPLVLGESVQDDRVQVENGQVLVNFPRGARVVSWQSQLTENDSLRFQALKEIGATESWSVVCTSVYRCSPAGVVPVSTVENGSQRFRYLPWPGDQLTVSVQRPEGVAGQTTTIDGVTATYTPGAQMISANLHLAARTSQGGFQKLTLPLGAAVDNVKINGIPRVEIRPQDRELLVPLVPGSNSVDLSYRLSWDRSVLSTMPPLSIEGGASNVLVTVAAPEKRVVLFLGGPAWGPAVLFWGELIVVVIVGLALSKISGLPLRSWEWIALGLGLILIPVSQSVWVVIWFGALLVRQKIPFTDKARFNLYQIVLGVLTVNALAVFLSVVRSGLLLSPDMNIRGNGSSNTLFKWYIDRVALDLPQPWIISIPAWSYGIVMLVWSTWLAFALIRWLRWGWHSASYSGVWRS